MARKAANLIIDAWNKGNGPARQHVLTETRRGNREFIWSGLNVRTPSPFMEPPLTGLVLLNLLVTHVQIAGHSRYKFILLRQLHTLYQSACAAFFIIIHIISPYYAHNKMCISTGNIVVSTGSSKCLLKIVAALKIKHLSQLT